MNKLKFHFFSYVNRMRKLSLKSASCIMEASSSAAFKFSCSSRKRKREKLMSELGRLNNGGKDSQRKRGI